MAQDPEEIVELTEFAKTIRPDDLQAVTDSTLAIELLAPQGGAPHVPPRLPAVAIDEALDGTRDGSAECSDLRVVRRLGAGGMGTVDLAQQHSLRREVAIKRLHPNLTSARHANASAVLTGVRRRL